jgi:S1-C subfamily serine protease
MRQPALVALFLLLGSAYGLVQTPASQPNGRLKIRAALVDKDLNVKPVPKLVLALQPRSGGKALAATTGFDGRAELELPAGQYHVSSAQPVDFQGKKYSWDVDLTIRPGDNQLELSMDNARVSEAASLPGRSMDELSTQFKHLQNAVVTVWSELGSGTGFLIKPKGLVVTNQHVIGKSGFIAVQFDPQRKVRAILLASDPQKDVAVLWANFSGIPEAITAPLPGKGDSPVVEGERVFTIGSPLSQRKILTTGVVSKVEPKAIISDIRIDHGNSGGPLFNSVGEVVGLTTFGQSGGSGGAGISGIVRIEEALSEIEAARKKQVSGTAPAADLLPVEPAATFPIDALRKVLEQKKFDSKPYQFDAGDYWVQLVTPPLRYYWAEEDKIRAAKARDKRNKKESEQPSSDAPDDLKNWGEYVGEYKSVITVRAFPKIKETAGSMWRRGLLAGGGVTGKATVRFKTDFSRMKLKCGEKEIQPIHPGRIQVVFDETANVNFTDESYAGMYSYPPDAISPSCGQVSLELYSEKNADAPAAVKILEEKTVSRVWTDFEPYRTAVTASPAK